ncbi:MAG: hydrogenase formation protein HypD [Anaerocolumna jejuensis]
MTLEQVRSKLKSYKGRNIKIMEVCGTHTASIFKAGIRSMLPAEIKLISGPGCPVCVTPSAFIDKLVEYSMKENYQVLTFGDMMKVRGNKYSLTQAKALGGQVRYLYSPLQSLALARENPQINYIFAAVGFETTTPLYAILLEEMEKAGIRNLKLLTSVKTMIPALDFLCEKEEIDGFLCPGHVSVIIGSKVYEPLAKRYQKPFVVTGFEGEHILASIYEIVTQIEAKEYRMKNLYTSSVKEEGNQKAYGAIMKYFEPCDAYWRGIGTIPGSGLRLKEEFLKYDAGSEEAFAEEGLPKGCRCTDVILGRINPTECPAFGKRCTPMDALGPCMVSSEGACGIWYKNR